MSPSATIESSAAAVIRTWRLFCGNVRAAQPSVQQAASAKASAICDRVREGRFVNAWNPVVAQARGAGRIADGSSARGRRKPQSACIRLRIQHATAISTMAPLS